MPLNAVWIEHDRDMEPWVAGSLSWLIPGAGQLYAKSLTQALFFLGLTVALDAASLASLTLPVLSPVWLPLLKLCRFILLPGLASLFAYRKVVRTTRPGFEEARQLARDPWLAVFLSLILPGAGHAYLLKGGLALVAVVTFVTLYISSLYYSTVFVAELIIYVLICVHAYVACQRHRRTRHSTMVWIVLVIVLVSFFENVALPRLHGRFVFAMSPIEGVSMNPTLKDGDQVIVSKYARRLRSHRAGDVVGFSLKNGITADSSHVMKRIVATGGETVQIENGRILVDGKERHLGIPRSTGMDYPGEIAIEHLGGDGNGLLMFGVDQPFRVPEDHYFVLGDNLAYSVDSRCFGPVPKQRIDGRAVKIIWPPRRIGNVR